MGKYGIPTKHKGRQYRSRLEARWASWFDLLGWEYEYEPFDLKGWIPDFLLTKADVLVEVKPVSFMTGETALKIERAQDSAPLIREVLLVGCTLPFKELVSSGRYGRLEKTDACEGCPFGVLLSSPPCDRPDLRSDWGTAYINRFEQKDHDGDVIYSGWGFFSQLDPIMRADPGFRFGSERIHDFAFDRIGQMGSPVCWGAWRPEFSQGPECRPLGMSGPVLQLWADAGNKTQWMPPRGAR